MQNIRSRGFWLVLVLWLFVATGYAANASPLRSDEAFQFSSQFVAPSTVVTTWKIAPGYYLYRDRFKFTAKPPIAVTAEYPATNVDLDKTTGRYEGYTGTLVIPVTGNTKDFTGATLHITYQGCAEQGFCYPPMTQDIVIGATVSSEQMSTPALSKLAKDQRIVSQLLGSTQHLHWILLIFVGLGLLLAFTPCVLPMIPILTSIIIGQRNQVSTKRAFLLSVSYVLGSSTAYAAAGVIAAMMGSSIQVWFQQPAFIITGSVIFVLLALSLFGLFELTLPAFINNRVLNLTNRQQGGAYLSVFFMGMFSALLVSPCVTAPLVGVLLYIASAGDVWLGGSALFALGIGMGLPLILIGITAGKWLPRRGPWMEGVRKCFGVIMLIMAVWLVSRIPYLSLPLLIYGVLLITSSVLIGVHLPRHIGWERLNRTVGAVLGIVGVILVMFAFNHSLWTSMVGPTEGLPMVSAQTGQFITVHSTQELSAALNAARDQQKPALLDFYADWCESCLEMDKEVFDYERVQTRLKNIVLIRADLTNNTSDDQELMKKYQVIAPPTVLLFNPQGVEQTQLRIIGAVSAKEFLARIDEFSRTNADSQRGE